MKEIFESLENLIIFAMVVTVSTDNVEAILKPYFSVTKYKLTIALVLTTIGVVSLNVGILESLDLITNSALYWIHYVDIFMSILVLTMGAKSIHKLADMITSFITNNNVSNKGE